jgi:hypothetical protein
MQNRIESINNKNDGISDLELESELLPNSLCMSVIELIHDARHGYCNLLLSKYNLIFGVDILIGEDYAQMALIFSSTSGIIDSKKIKQGFYDYFKSSLIKRFNDQNLASDDYVERLATHYNKMIKVYFNDNKAGINEDKNLIVELVNLKKVSVKTFEFLLRLKTDFNSDETLVIDRFFRTNKIDLLKLTLLQLFTDGFVCKSQKAFQTNTLTNLLCYYTSIDTVEIQNFYRGLDFASYEALVKSINNYYCKDKNNDIFKLLTLDELENLTFEAINFVTGEKFNFEQKIDKLYLNFVGNLSEILEYYRNNKNQLEEIEQNPKIKEKLLKFHIDLEDLIEYYNPKLEEIEQDITVSDRNKKNGLSFENPGLLYTTKVDIENNLKYLQEKKTELNSLNTEKQREIFIQNSILEFYQKFNSLLSRFQYKRTNSTNSDFPITNKPEIGTESELWNRLLEDTNKFVNYLAISNVELNFNGVSTLKMTFDKLNDIYKRGVIDDKIEVINSILRFSSLIPINKSIEFNSDYFLRYLNGALESETSVEISLSKPVKIEDLLSKKPSNDKILENISGLYTSKGDNLATMERINKIAGYQNSPFGDFRIEYTYPSNSQLPIYSVIRRTSISSNESINKKNSFKVVQFFVDNSTDKLPFPIGNYELIEVVNLTTDQPLNFRIELENELIVGIKYLKDQDLLSPILVEFKYKKTQATKKTYSDTDGWEDKEEKLPELEKYKTKHELTNYPKFITLIEGLNFLKNDWTVDYRVLLKEIKNHILSLNITYDYLLNERFTIEDNKYIDQSLDSIYNRKLANCFVINKGFVALILDILNIQYRFDNCILSSSAIIKGGDNHIRISVLIDSRWETFDATKLLLPGDSANSALIGSQSNIDINFQSKDSALDYLRKVNFVEPEVIALKEKIKLEVDFQNKFILFEQPKINFQLNCLFKILSPALFGSKSQMDKDTLASLNFSINSKFDDRNLYRNSYIYILRVILDLSPIDSISSDINKFGICRKYLNSVLSFHAYDKTDSSKISFIQKIISDLTSTFIYT